MQEILLKIGYLERNYQKALKIFNIYVFRTQSIFMNKIMKNKRGLELVISPSSGYKKSSEKFPFISDVLPDLV